MSNSNKIWFVVFIIIIWFGSSSFNMNFEKPKSDNLLFIINRSRDANEIWYSINSNHLGKVDIKNPIQAFWVKKDNNNEIEPLTWIQKKYAYGIKIINKNSNFTDQWNFQFVSYNKRNFTLKKEGDQFKVYTSSKGEEIEVTQIFVQIDGGSFWVPSVSYVKLTGTNLETGNSVVEIIKP